MFSINIGKPSVFDIYLERTTVHFQIYSSMKKCVFLLQYWSALLHGSASLSYESDHLIEYALVIFKSLIENSMNSLSNRRDIPLFPTFESSPIDEEKRELFWLVEGTNSEPLAYSSVEPEFDNNCGHYTHTTTQHIWEKKRGKKHRSTNGHI